MNILMKQAVNICLKRFLILCFHSVRCSSGFRVLCYIWSLAFPIDYTHTHTARAHNSTFLIVCATVTYI